MSTEPLPDSFTDSVVVAASPAEVYAVVSDVTRVGEWSPICQECWWEDADSAGSVGSWFGGRNVSGERTWETRSQVKEAEPGEVFAWQVNGDLVAWRYQMTAVDGGTELTETWALNDATKQVFADNYGEKAQTALDARRQEAVDGIPATLAAIKRIVEAA